MTFLLGDCNTDCLTKFKTPAFVTVCEDLNPKLNNIMISLIRFVLCIAVWPSWPSAAIRYMRPGMVFRGTGIRGIYSITSSTK